MKRMPCKFQTCQQWFSSSEKLEKHVSEKHSTKVSCGVKSCQQWFSSRQALLKHINVQHDEDGATISTGDSFKRRFKLFHQDNIIQEREIVPKQVHTAIPKLMAIQTTPPRRESLKYGVNRIAEEFKNTSEKYY